MKHQKKQSFKSPLSQPVNERCWTVRRQRGGVLARVLALSTLPLVPPAARLWELGASHMTT